MSSYDPIPVGRIIKALRSTSSITKAAKKLGVTRNMIYKYKDMYADVANFLDNPVRESDLEKTASTAAETSTASTNNIVDINYVLREKQRLYESIPYVEDIMDQVRIEVNNAIKETVDALALEKTRKARKNQGEGSINVSINDPDAIIKAVEKAVNSELQGYVRVRSEKRSSMDSLEKFLKVFGDEISKETERVQRMTESELLKEAKELSKEIEKNVKERSAAFGVI